MYKGSSLHSFHEHFHWPILFVGHDIMIVGVMDSVAYAQSCFIVSLNLMIPSRELTYPLKKQWLEDDIFF